MKFILAKKIEMTQLFDDKGNVVPVTKVKAGPCLVTLIKKEDGADGYSSVQLGFDVKKRLSHALKGHLKDLKNFRYLREFRVSEPKELKRGDEISVDTFEPGDVVKVTGTSKGRGFAGVVKRHGFKGTHKTHGNKDQERMPGSIGSTGPARVFKGMRMAGHMGDERVTVKNLKIVDIDSENDFLFIKGAVPGARNGLLMISAQGELEIGRKTKEQGQDKEEGVEKSEENTGKDVGKKEEVKKAPEKESKESKETSK